MLSPRRRDPGPLAECLAPQPAIGQATWTCAGRFIEECQRTLDGLGCLAGAAGIQEQARETDQPECQLEPPFGLVPGLASQVLPIADNRSLVLDAPGHLGVAHRNRPGAERQLARQKGIGLKLLRPIVLLQQLPVNR